MNPFKVKTKEEIGEKWIFPSYVVLADFGTDDDGHHFLITSRAPSELWQSGTAKEQAEFVCDLLNTHYANRNPGMQDEQD